jgi:hypothetical protein
MKTKYLVLLAVFAGFAGGFASHYIGPQHSYAQVEASAQPPGNMLPQASPLPEIRGQKFVLVDDKGVARGVFGIENNGVPVLEITDSKHRVWIPVLDPAATSPVIVGGPNCPRHPTLLPEN